MPSYPPILDSFTFARITIVLRQTAPDLHAIEKIEEASLGAALQIHLHDGDCPGRSAPGQPCATRCPHSALRGTRARRGLPIDLVSRRPSAMALDTRSLPGVEITRGNTFDLHIVLIGPAIDQLSRVLDGMEAVGRASGELFEIAEVRGLVPMGEEVLYVPGSGMPVAPPHAFRWSEVAALVARLSPPGCVVSLAKPLNATRAGTQAALTDLPCTELVRLCVARLRALALVYGERPLAPDDDAALRAWGDELQTWAAQVKHRLLIPGRIRIGTAPARIGPRQSGLNPAYLYRGYLTPLLPVLLAGSLLHVGRHVEHGNGVFSIDALRWPSNGLWWH
jgi:hypothetical protein